MGVTSRTCPPQSSLWPQLLLSPPYAEYTRPPGSARVLSRYSTCSKSITSLSKSSPGVEEALYGYFFSLCQSIKLSGQIIFSTHTKYTSVSLDFLPHSRLSLAAYKHITHFLPSLSPQELYLGKITLK